MSDTTVYIPADLAEELDQLAEREMRSRSAMARYLMRRAIDDLKTALASGKPYPAVPEAPADCDAQ